MILKNILYDAKKKNIHPNIDFTDEAFGLYAIGEGEIIE